MRAPQPDRLTDQVAGGGSTSDPRPRGSVVSVSRDDTHRFSKVVHPAIELVAGIGVVGDAHASPTIQHRSRVRRDPTQPNLRQVHLIHVELLEELVGAGHPVAPGEIGENVLTRGIALLDLPAGTRLALGASAAVEVTGLRNPCVQLDRFQPGLRKAVLGRDAEGGVIRKSGVMAVVVSGGVVRAGDPIRVTPPAGPHRALAPV